MKNSQFFSAILYFPKEKLARAKLLNTHSCNVRKQMREKFDTAIPTDGFKTTFHDADFAVVSTEKRAETIDNLSSSQSCSICCIFTRAWEDALIEQKILGR